VFLKNFFLPFTVSCIPQLTSTLDQSTFFAHLLNYKNHYKSNDLYLLYLNTYSNAVDLLKTLLL